LASRVAFAQSHVSKWRVREHAVWYQPIARAALPAGQIVPNDPKVVLGYVRELWATGAFPDGPDLGRARLQPLVNADVAMTVHLNTGLLQPHPGGLRNAPRRDQDVAALDVLLTGGRAHDKADCLSGSLVQLQGLGRPEHLHTVVAEHPEHL